MCFEQAAGCTNDVADIPFLECLVDTFGQTIALEAKLNLPGPVLQFDKTGLAHDTLDHHSTGHTDVYVFLAKMLVFVLSVALMQLLGQRIAPEIIRKCIAVFT